MESVMKCAALIIVAGVISGALIVAITLAGIVFMNKTQLIHLELVPPDVQQGQKL